MSDSPVDVALRYAQALWPHDVAPGSEAVAFAWGRALTGYSVDELCAAFDAEVRTAPKMPSLSVILDDLREAKRKATPPTPRLAAPKGEPAVLPALLDYRQKLRAELVAFHRGSDGTLDPERLKRIDDEVKWVGPREAAFLAKAGIDVAVTMPSRANAGGVGA